VEYGKHCRCTGYGTPDNPHAAKPEEIPDGCPVIDKRDAVETAEGFSWVFHGPMVDVDLPTGSISECPSLKGNIMVDAMESDLGNAFGGLATLHKATKGKPGPLDSVDIATYIEGWRAKGARIGHYEGGEIVWDD
jgi:hypothetical protein